MKILLPKIFLFFVSLSFLVAPSALGQEVSIKDTISYKLAVLHTQAAEPESAILGQPVMPSRETITRFLTLMEALKARCINPETEMADMIVGVWKMLQSKGYHLSLLALMEELTNMARNRVMFGDEKVDFKTTTSYWISQSPLGQQQPGAAGVLQSSPSPYHK